MEKRILNNGRIRFIQGGFAFIPHRFLTDGFLSSLNSCELLLYLFLVLVSDAKGLSFYSDQTICRLLKISSKALKAARQVLIASDLIAFEAPLYQVLELPRAPRETKEDPAYPAVSSSTSCFSDLRRQMED